MNKLQRLHNKFDLANSAASEFDVALQLIHADDIAFDPSFDARNFVEKIGRRALWINKRLMLPQEFVGELLTAGNSASFD